jgi:hypothetical protein
MTSGDRVFVCISLIVFLGILASGLVEYQTKKLQLEELKLEKECVCK